MTIASKLSCLSATANLISLAGLANQSYLQRAAIQRKSEEC